MKTGLYKILLSTFTLIYLMGIEVQANDTSDCTCIVEVRPTFRSVCGNFEITCTASYSTCEGELLDVANTMVCEEDVSGESEAACDYCENSVVTSLTGSYSRSREESAACRRTWKALIFHELRVCRRELPTT